MTLRKYLMKAQKGKCHYCNVQMTTKTKGKYFVTEDHITPRSRGGGNSYWNLIGACFTCNNMRGDLPYEVFKAFIQIHGNSRTISQVLRGLTEEEYQRSRMMYDEIIFHRKNSSTPFHLRVRDETKYRREYMALTKRLLESIVVGVGHKRRWRILANNKDEEECPTPLSPPLSMKPTSASLHPTTRIVKMW